MTKRKHKDNSINKSLKQKLEDAAIEYEVRKGKARKRRAREGKR